MIQLNENMKVYSLTRSQIIKKPLREVFDFFKQPENLSEITPKSLGFKILTPLPLKMREGMIIDYTVKPMIVRIHWRTMITTYEPPYKFIDEQMLGPYTFWHHTHIFEEVDGGTKTTDEVKYVLPFGWLGRVVHALFIRKQLNSIFDYRTIVIERYFTN